MTPAAGPLTGPIPPAAAPAHHALAAPPGAALALPAPGGEAGQELEGQQQEVDGQTALLAGPGRNPAAS